MLERERFRISVRFGKIVANKVDIFLSILKHLEESFLPRPNELYISDKSPLDVSSFTENVIVEAIRNTNSFELETNDNSLSIGFSSINNVYAGISIKAKELKKENIKDLRLLLIELIKKNKPTLALATFGKITENIHEKHLEDTENEDVFLLNWLQYYNPQEFAKRGGEAIFENPYIKTEKMGEGILIQVGESPYDAYTPEGEELLVKASLAMPVV